jgi:hypothetical protein
MSDILKAIAWIPPEARPVTEEQRAAEEQRLAGLSLLGAALGAPVDVAAEMNKRGLPTSDQLAEMVEERQHSQTLKERDELRAEAQKLKAELDAHKAELDAAAKAEADQERARLLAHEDRRALAVEVVRSIEAGKRERKGKKK